MPTYDQSNATCHVFTFKKGFLSSLAHDLKLQAFKFEIKVSGSAKDTAKWQRIAANFDAASLRTVCAMKDGERSPAKLSDNDCRDIDRNVASAVLRPARFPVISFKSQSIAGSAGGFLITGELTLCGVTRALVLTLKRRRNGYQTEIMIDQRDFGITPFSALMGAMQIKPEIMVRLEIKHPTPLR